MDDQLRFCALDVRSRNGHQGLKRPKGRVKHRPAKLFVLVVIVKRGRVELDTAIEKTGLGARLIGQQRLLRYRLKLLDCGCGKDWDGAGLVTFADIAVEKHPRLCAPVQAGSPRNAILVQDAMHVVHGRKSVTGVKDVTVAHLSQWLRAASEEVPEAREVVCDCDRTVVERTPINVVSDRILKHEPVS